MLKFASPESCGLSAKQITKFVNNLNKRQLHMHSVLMMRGDNIIYEGYWAPFNKDYNHRMYSVTKSFVSIAIGLCQEEGLLNLDDCVYDYFPDRVEKNIDEHTKKQTIRQMLTMTTVGHPCEWFTYGDPDRTHCYFSDHGKRRPSGTIWEYDSAGSQVLSSLVERVTGKTLFDYLNEKVFKHLDSFHSAKILQTPNGDSWGDSAMICTTRDLATFARFVMNYGTYEGKRLMNEEYLREATSPLVHNRWDGHLHAFRHGYGYQIWSGEQGSFAFVGMGDQLAICIPKYDFVFCCTGDNQGNECARDYLVYQLFDNIVDFLESAPLCESKEDTAELKKLTDSLELFSIEGASDSPWREKINGVTYECHEGNNLHLSEFTFHFENAEKGVLKYTANGRAMEIPFQVNKNVFGLFPELGYSRERGAVRTTDGHMYKDAVSFAWCQENKIMLLVQIIDEYFGNASLTFAFNGDEATAMFARTAEDFLWDYDGQAYAKIKK